MLTPLGLSELEFSPLADWGGAAAAANDEEDLDEMRENEQTVTLEKKLCGTQAAVCKPLQIW
jgi:hypothetical protein